jgi:hypothetical protein
MEPLAPKDVTMGCLQGKSQLMTGKWRREDWLRGAKRSATLKILDIRFEARMIPRTGVGRRRIECCDG